MPRRLLLVSAGALVLVLAGCSQDGPAAQQQDRATRSPAPSEASTTHEAAESADPLAAEATDRVPGGVDEVVRSGDGSTLVLLGNMYNDVTHYRVYDERWRPTSPPMRVEVYLSGARGTPRGFVARATTTKPSGRYSLREWVTVRSDGRLRVAGVPERVARPDWFTRNTAWYEQPDGSVCSHVHHGHSGDPVRSSLDGGRSWQVTDTSAIPGESGSRLWSCSAAGDRVVVLTGGAEYAHALHTFDRRSGALLATLAVGDGTPVDPYAWQLLPDGSVVAATDRPGMVVATDPSNAAVELRTGPFGGSFTTILDDQIVRIRADRQVAISRDRGRSWRLVDLRLPAFS